MHELAVTEYLFKLVTDQATKAGIKKVDAIHLSLGDQCDYVPEIIEQYLQVMSEASLLSDVKITAKYLESTIECKDCNSNFTRHEFKGACPKCGSDNLKLNRRTDFIVDSIEGN